MKTTKFDKANLKAIRADIDQALKAVAAKYDISLRLGDITYSGTTFTGKLNAKVNDVEAIDEENKKEFEAYARILGLEPTDFGRTFISAGRAFKITRLKLRNRKMPVIAVCQTTGKSFKFSENIVKVLLQRQSAA